MLFLHCTHSVLLSIILGGDNGPPLSPNFLNELRNLYYFITEKLISYMSRIHSFKREMGELLIDVLCYISAVDYDNMATFPEVFASCLLYFLPSPNWERAADEVLNRLCRYVLPKCLGDIIALLMTLIIFWFESMIVCLVILSENFVVKSMQ